MCVCGWVCVCVCGWVCVCVWVGVCVWCVCVWCVCVCVGGCVCSPVCVQVLHTSIHNLNLCQLWKRRRFWDRALLVSFIWLHNAVPVMLWCVEDLNRKPWSEDITSVEICLDLVFVVILMNFSQHIYRNYCWLSWIYIEIPIGVWIQARYRGADKSLARPGRKNLMFLSEWREFPLASCLAGKKTLMTARVSVLLKSRASMACSRACFLPGGAKDLSAPWYNVEELFYWLHGVCFIVHIRLIDVSNCE